MKYGNLNFLEPSGLFQGCNRTALPLLLRIINFGLIFLAVKTIEEVSEQHYN